MDGRQPEPSVGEAGKIEKRTPRSIRFYDLEWERIEAFADKRGLSAAEFVRFAALAAVEDDLSVEDGSGGRVGRLAPLIERTFRYAYMIATNMRGEMLEAGRGEELDALVRTARALQDEVQDKRPE